MQHSSPKVPKIQRRPRQHKGDATPKVDGDRTPEPPKSTSRVDPVGTPTKQMKGRKSRIDPAKARLESYASQFFKEISETVFHNLFGPETRLEWSNRLTRTAGKAHYSRHLDGSEESRIELSAKVVDREERVRTTLSHEMCHLAAWRFDGNRDGGHGPEWTEWARKVMLRYPGIKITPTHSYEIEYPFLWKCTVCGKSYGRWQNSISTANKVCTCDGELTFVKTNSSYTVTGREESATHSAKPSPRRPKVRPNACIIDLTCDGEVEELTQEMDSIDLTRIF